MCTYSSYEGNKLLDIPEELSSITILGDRQDWFFDSGFAGKKKGSLIWLQKKQRNPYSCTIPSFIKDPLRKIITTHQKDVKYTVTHLSFATVSRKQTNITSSLSFSLSKYVRSPLRRIFTHPTY